MNQLICPSCRKTVEPGLHGIQLECKHWVHPKCLDRKSPDFERCAACKGDVNLNVPQFDETEPDSIDGRDYVQNPLSDSIFTRLLRKGEPFKWIADKTPLSWLIQEKGFGLQRMIMSGVRFEDFMAGGYNWDDMKAFKDFGMPERKERAREALFALKCNAEHLRDYQHLIGNMIGDLGINGRHIVELYGLHFPENSCSPLVTMGGRNDKPWHASHLVKLGFKMHDIVGAGITFVEQYAYLNPTDADEVAMNVTDQDISGLPSLSELEKQKRASAALAAEAAKVSSAHPPPRPNYITIPKFEMEKPKPMVHRLKKR